MVHDGEILLAYRAKCIFRMSQKTEHHSGEMMNRKLLIGLVVVVFALMLSNMMLGKMALDLYQTYNALRRDPLGILHQQEIQQGEYDYFLIGDSLIARWKIPEYAVANHGISAQTSGQALYRMRLLGDKIHAKKIHYLGWGK
ncbi:hypothetical protein U14_04688 [Candidatus Moduliflexus flocculans]|uniref:Uncharacterized protein n=1 Tax=Candidatus Moduliflexus flocculans TaxID=1499966 RepID=A0A0S6W4M7_9BACT|nr:hypothetical protein U14_04688 [Candidatus Moduliflexus flocculans]